MRSIIILLIIISLSSCQKVENLTPRVTHAPYKTENVIVVVIDGPRFSETWGHPEKKYIPFLANRLRDEGVYNRHFYNLGFTKTIPGHTAVITGVYENLDNNGLQFPTFPSILQQWLYITRNDPTSAWIVTSKEKLKVMGNCSHLDWRNSFNPSIDAANRQDIHTYGRLIQILEEHHPKLVFVNFRGPDIEGHAGNWEGYLKAIRRTDSLFNEVYNFIQQDSIYAGKTTLILTNDHGRHLDEIQNGFESHGDHCLGCTHINFFATGPDFKKGLVVDQTREQIDIAPTIGQLMGFELQHGEGDVMEELFNPTP